MNKNFAGGLLACGVVLIIALQIVISPTVERIQHLEGTVSDNQIVVPNGSQINFVPTLVGMCRRHRHLLDDKSYELKANFSSKEILRCGRFVANTLTLRYRFHFPRPQQWDNWKTGQWNTVYFAPVMCSLPGMRNKVPCCGGGDFIMASVRRVGYNTSLYVSSEDFTNGYYSLSVFPTLPGKYKVLLNVGRKVMKNNRFKVKYLVPRAKVALEKIITIQSNGENVDTEWDTSGRVCQGSDLNTPGEWRSDPTGKYPNGTYHVPMRKCHLKMKWTSEEVRKCVNKKYILVLGDSTTMEMLSAMHVKLYDNYPWALNASDPGTRQFDLGFTNDPAMGVSKFTLRLAHLWNGGPCTGCDQANFRGLTTYCNKRIRKLVQTHLQRCHIHERERIFKDLIGPPILESLNLTIRSCDHEDMKGISVTPDVIFIASAMHDYYWMKGGSPYALHAYRDYLRGLVEEVKFLSPTSKIIIRGCPATSHRFKAESVISNMMNQVAKELAVQYNISYLDVYPMVYPFVNTRQTDGHHWFRDVDGTVTIRTALGEAIQSMYYSQLCNVQD
eukprot:PhF_6_TR13366/c0_g1_i1/m.21179